MNVFLDESGIHLKTGHSVFALIYISPSNTYPIYQAMSAIEASVGPSSLHWSGMAWPVRAKVFMRIKHLPFNYQIAAINNPIRYDQSIVRQVLGKLLADKDDEIGSIFIDGRKSNQYEAQLKKSLRDFKISTRKLRTVNDRAYAGVQLADLVAGVYRHQLDKPSAESARLQRMIASKQI